MGLLASGDQAESEADVVSGGESAARPVLAPSANPAPFSLSLLEASIPIAFLVYAALFIYLTSFVIGGTRYFCLFDDDMISMRYAANLAHHQGLVWNPGGERVLGFTNLLWVLYMAPFHLLPIPVAKMPLLIQASGAVFVLASLICTKKIVEELFPNRRYVGALALVLVAFYGPLANWSLQGTEVSVLTFFVTASALLALRSLDSNLTPVKLYVLLGISTLCRLDMAVFAGSILVTLSVLRPEHWKRHLLLGGSIVGAFLAAQGTFNFLYYGSLLPNTYYLKMSGYPLLARLERGVVVACKFVLPLLPLIVAVAMATPRRARFAGTNLLGAAVLGQIAYSIWVGGDAWEWWGGANRYVAIVMPLFFVLAAFSLAQYCLLIERWVASHTPRIVRAEQCAMVLLLAAALLLSNGSNLRSNFLLAKPLQTSEPQPHPWGSNEHMVRQALLVRSVTDQEARIAVVWAGALPYFADRYAIDLLGKNDVKIAHEQMHTEANLAPENGFWPGHLKWDYAYSIGERKPDVVVQLWGADYDEIPWLWTDYAAVSVRGYNWFIRRASRHIRGGWSAP